MSPLLLFLLAFYQFQTLIRSELLNAPPLQSNSYRDIQNDINSIIPPDFGDASLENEIVNEMPLIKTEQDQTEVQFREPIKSVNIDYSKNSLVLKFRKQHQQQQRSHDEADTSLMATDFMRFGKRAYEWDPTNTENSLTTKEKGERFERSSGNNIKNENVGLRDSRGDNFMRFGRSPADFMRLGRDQGQDFMRFGRSPGQDFMRFGRSPGQDFMRFGRDPADFMRLGRSPGQDFMRFGRSPGQDFMRFGRDPADFMRLGRSPGQDFMRFGRSPGQDFIRFGRDPADFMRLGRSPGQDFMRFGRSPGQDFMRFGRSPSQDFMRFGRSPDDFMRLGRSNQKSSLSTDKNFIRFGRPDNFMRFGRSQSEPPTDRSSNFMRFGRSNKHFTDADDKESNHTTAALEQKNELKAVAKIIHDSRQNSEDGNPMDKAIQVLFNKQNSEDNETTKAEEDNDASESQDYRR